MGYYPIALFEKRFYIPNNKIMTDKCKYIFDIDKIV